MYLAALYFAWVTSLVLATNVEKYITSHYKLWVFFSFASPLQGLFNSFNYFRPRVSRLIQKRRKLQRPQKMRPADDGGGGETRFFREWKIVSSAEPANMLADDGDNDEADARDDDGTASVTGAVHDPAVLVDSARRRQGIVDDESVFAEDIAAELVPDWKVASAFEPANGIVRWNSAASSGAVRSEVKSERVDLDSKIEMDSIEMDSIEMATICDMEVAKDDGDWNENREIEF